MRRYFAPFAAVAVTLVLVFAASATAGQASKQPVIKRESMQRLESIKGQDLYHSYCAVCHGASGKGDGPAAKALKTLPSDLTTIAKRRGKFSTADVEDQITGRTPMAAAHGTREMPMWGPAFRSTAENPDVGKLAVANLVEYVESLQVK